LFLLARPGCFCSEKPFRATATENLRNTSSYTSVLLVVIDRQPCTGLAQACETPTHCHKAPGRLQVTVEITSFCNMTLVPFQFSWTWRHRPPWRTQPHDAGTSRQPGRCDRGPEHPSTSIQTINKVSCVFV